jgi:hypothetical protein
MEAHEIVEEDEKVHEKQENQLSPKRKRENVEDLQFDEMTSAELTAITKRKATQTEIERLHSLLPQSICETLLENGACIAGGAATFVLVPTVDKRAVSDVDGFVFSDFEKCATDIDKLVLSQKQYHRQTATLNFLSEQLPLPIQLIWSPGSPEDVLQSFDFDYVQCGILGFKDSKTGRIEYQIIQTKMCEVAHKTFTVRYVLDYPYNPQRLAGRLCKAQEKGFCLPAPFDSIDELGLKLHKPRNCANWEYEQHIPVSIWSIASRKSEKWQEHLEDALVLKHKNKASWNAPAGWRSKLHLTLKEALAELPLKSFSWEEYGEDEDTTELKLEPPLPPGYHLTKGPQAKTEKTIEITTAHSRMNEDQFLNAPVRQWVLLGGGKNPRKQKGPDGIKFGFKSMDPLAKYIRDQQQLLEEREKQEDKIVDKSKAEAFELENRRMFFLIRNLELVQQGKLKEAITSITSDVRKLQPKCEDSSGFAFGAAMDFMMFMDRVKYEGGGKITRSLALSHISRLLNNNHPFHF